MRRLSAWGSGLAGSADCTALAAVLTRVLDGDRGAELAAGLDVIDAGSLGRLVPGRRGHGHDRRLAGGPDDAGGSGLAVPGPQLGSRAVCVPAGYGAGARGDRRPGALRPRLLRRRRPRLRPGPGHRLRL